MENERIDQLYSADIQIIQSPTVFSFSLDAVLLANFPRVPHTGSIVDLCAGNGAVGLFLAPKTTAQITQVEIQEKLADMGRRSIILNHLEKQYTMINDDLKNILANVPANSVDLILCNPPYFKDAPDKKINPNEHLALARHEITTNLQEVAAISGKLLKSKGHFALVHRPERLTEILSVLTAARLMPKRLQFIYPKAGREANMVLIEAIKDGKPGLKVLPAQIVYTDDNQYTPEIHEMLYGK
ncbi:tRNA1(Val) (adenine(37)-N6)-methyltransferase [Enterococcus timonensis]|uniref:tRNA1(Val) (adenine(37)-N6)-methyltransferase n=1 Tax=Enterococcus timonensis TaxID=1852364 RepID=UPI0008DA835C|nr:tRNA1(Val) (adenine(37)-N6)-methyltransferase [Enterococcus timonensis]